MWFHLSKKSYKEDNVHLIVVSQQNSVKFKFSMLPNWKCYSSHVTIDDRVGQCCSSSWDKTTPICFREVKKNVKFINFIAINAKKCYTFLIRNFLIFYQDIFWNIDSFSDNKVFFRCVLLFKRPLDKLIVYHNFTFYPLLLH